MSVRPHSPTRHRGRRKGKRGHSGEQTAAQAGMGRGMPRYLARPGPSVADVSSSSEREAKNDGVHQVTEAPVATPMGRAAAAAMQAGDDRGRQLGEGERAPTEKRLGMDFSGVRVTERSPLAAAFGANAMTFGEAIHFAPGHSVTSDLLGHELTHVAQQRRFGAEGAQFDVSLNAEDADTGLGLLDISMVTGSPSGSGGASFGMETEIDFLPHADAPYANRIGLIQTADVEELGSPAQPDFDWTGSDEANREEVKTPEGTFIDTLHADLPADRNAEPWYWADEPAANADNPASDNRFGWNRSAQDRGSAHLWDFPNWDQPSRFEFETVAMGRDSRTAYGAVRWGFETDGTSGTSNEWFEIQEITASGGDERYQSDVFDAALGNYRDFYVHEPVIVYFGYNEAVATESELAKLSDAASYMSDNPEADITLTASADMQGGSGPGNRRLALERMNSVHTQLLSMGIPADRIHRDESRANASRARGSTDPALRDTEGSFHANRQVTVTFQNVRSLPP